MEFGSCDFHDEPINEGTYRWKGCWGCHHFTEGELFPYIFVAEASVKLGVSEGTVRRWIREGKLKAKLFDQQRHTGFLPAPGKYHIQKLSLRNLKPKTKTMRNKKRSSEP